LLWPKNPRLLAADFSVSEFVDCVVYSSAPLTARLV